MIRFQYILYIVYFALTIISYPYLRNAYFPQFPSKVERLIMWILASFWFISVPVTMVMKQNDGSDVQEMPVSYDGFLGREA